MISPYKSLTTEQVARALAEAEKLDADKLATMTELAAELKCRRDTLAHFIVRHGIAAAGERMGTKVYRRAEVVREYLKRQ